MTNRADVDVAFVAVLLTAAHIAPVLGGVAASRAGHRLGTSAVRLSLLTAMVASGSDDLGEQLRDARRSAAGLPAWSDLTRRAGTARSSTSVGPVAREW